MFSAARVGGSLAGLGGLVSGLTVPFGPARAFEPMTALLVVNTAMGVMRLMSGPQGGAGDLMAIQMEMLKQISAQLSAIQKGVLEILDRLDRLEQLIGELPKQVVFELYRARISGLNARYKELMATYEA